MRRGGTTNTSMGSASPDGDRRGLLEVSAMDFAYGRLQILFDVSVQVQRGEMLALLGTNGAGKSTLLKVIAGLLTPSQGQIRFDGHDITHETPQRRARRGISLIPGGHAVFPDMTVAENLEIYSFLVRGSAECQERAEQALDAFPKLRERFRQPAGRLSGGEQQQLALTRAHILDPTLLCIDELSLGLAPGLVEQLFAYVRQICAGGTTVVLVEQSLNVAASLCERAIFMEKGSVRFEGRTADLLERDDIARAVFLATERS